MSKLFDAVDSQANKDSTYTAKIQVPQYVPSEEMPPLEALVDHSKYSKLVAAINRSDVSDDEKRFLRLAATRHIVFRYSLIADYYANASKEMQELMEQSALVILDVDDAIANGYVKLSKDIRKILEQSGEIAGEK